MDDTQAQARHERAPEWLAATSTKHLRILINGYLHLEAMRGGWLLPVEREAVAQLYAELDRRREAGSEAV